MTYQQYLSKYKLNKLPYEKKLIVYTKKIDQVSELCGDGLSFYFLLEGGKIKDVGFDGYGCFLSRLSASLLAKKFLGKPTQMLAEFDEKKVFKLLGFPVVGIREQCVLMPLKAFRVLK